MRNLKTIFVLLVKGIVQGYLLQNHVAKFQIISVILLLIRKI